FPFPEALCAKRKNIGGLIRYDCLRPDIGCSVSSQNRQRSECIMAEHRPPQMPMPPMQPPMMPPSPHPMQPSMQQMVIMVPVPIYPHHHHHMPPNHWAPC